ncbi:glycoside hydrolase family 3 N-terminal domain-containing protein [Olsenella uli]|uniref:glycoside hydrolase family 3 N-terminal domain-containing protein n=1 Tax=Olsenella uli TaxID=133926 RepID=UPI00256FDB9B|nr:glycoside hydrolase family 3 N-terminal domain-containing protein [Olsenella uli]
MIELVCANFDDVVLVYNGANTFELGFVDEIPQISSVLWVPPAGQTGFVSLGRILAGDINPSGRTSDTFVADFTQAPSFNNFGEFIYDNMDEFEAGGFRGRPTIPSFVTYTDGIYVGYRFWETAADEGLVDYDSAIVYPFGHGLSYTAFEQEMGPLSVGDGSVSFDVTVTNTGDVAGKDVVQAYYNPPYTNGGLEKASANLVAFEKTGLIEPGESQTIEVTFDVEDMASYDTTAAEGAGAYVLESGDYVISLNENSHDVISEQTWSCPETIVYDADNPRSSDKAVAANQFQDVEIDAPYLSRANGFANYEEAVAAPTDFSLPEELKATFVNNSSYDPTEFDDPSDEMPTTGADNGLSLADMYGLDYDDPAWDSLLDQLTFEDMDTLIASGGYGNASIESISKAYQYDLDGPAALNNNFTGVGSIGFPSSVSVACTWNKGLAYEYGLVIGDMAIEMDTTGWYAPAVNIHRSPFCGRTFEYFSEDALLTGAIAAQEVAGAKERGVYAYVKHFALNEQETNRESMLCTWANEQSIREVYLRPFELTVKDGGTTAIMSSFNYVGTTYSGGCSELLDTVLRGEWGFRGAVITDYYGGFGYQNADQCIRNGNDLMLASTDTTNHVTDDSATSVLAMREAAHNILYMAGNSWMYENGIPQVGILAWQWVDYIVSGVIVVALVALEVIAVRRFLAARDA